MSPLLTRKWIGFLPGGQVYCTLAETPRLGAFWGVEATTLAVSLVATDTNFKKVPGQQSFSSL